METVCHNRRGGQNKKVKRANNRPGQGGLAGTEPRHTQPAARQPRRIAMRSFITGTVLTLATMVAVPGVQAKPPGGNGGKPGQGQFKQGQGQLKQGQSGKNQNYK